MQVHPSSHAHSAVPLGSIKTCAPFQTTQEELKSGEEIARCPSCSLYITVIYDPVGGRLARLSVAAAGSGPGVQPPVLLLAAEPLLLPPTAGGLRECGAASPQHGSSTSRGAGGPPRRSSTSRGAAAGGLRDGVRQGRPRTGRLASWSSFGQSAWRSKGPRGRRVVGIIEWPPRWDGEGAQQMARMAKSGRLGLQERRCCKAGPAGRRLKARARARAQVCRKFAE